MKKKAYRLNHILKMEKSEFVGNITSQLDEIEFISDVCRTFDIEFNLILEIVKDENIQITSLLTTEFKSRFIQYLDYCYDFYFSVPICSNKRKYPKPKIKSSFLLRKQVIANKEILLAKLENGLENNKIGLFEELRIIKINDLKNEILLLKRMEKQSKSQKKNNSKSSFKKPMPRIIYTPVGGKVR
ncbi:MAG: hypothetical protein Q8T04_13980 [Bacteroidota bacterium]|nr:hypothetical protein [Bacteroidota bacterium]